MANSADEPTDSEQWECFGVAIKSGLSSSWVLRFLSALENGDIASCARSAPPRTGNKILDAAGSPSSEWWSDYRGFCSSGTPAPSSWRQWLDTEMLVAVAPTLRIIEAGSEAERKRFSSRPRAHRAPGLWSDVEVLAWFAAHDDELVAKVRDFGHQDEILRVEGRAAGLRYLRVQVALRFCHCSSNRPLLAIYSSEECPCICSAWEMMIECLKEARLGALRVDTSGRKTHASPLDFLDTDRRVNVGYPALLSQHGELLFEGTEVRSASSKPTAKRRGRRPIDDAKHLAEMSEWLAQNEGKTPREAAQIIEAMVNIGKGAVEPESFIRRLVDKYESGQSA